MVRAFRTDSHLLKGKADLPADIFAPVIRCNIHISGMIVRNPGGLAVFVQIKKVKFHLCAEGEGNSFLFRIGNGFF